MAKKSFAARKAEAASNAKPTRAAAAPADTDGAEGNETTVAGVEVDSQEEEDVEYEVLEPGTIIGDIHFPNKEAKEGEEWLVWLKPSEAEHQQAGGICLRRHNE